MLTTILTAITGFISKLKYSTIITIVAIILFIILFLEFKHSGELKTQLKYSLENINASKDSIHVVQTNDKKAEEDKLAYVVDKNSDLQKLNDSLALQVKNIKGTVNTITVTNIKIVHDTVSLAAETVISDSVIKTKFDFDSNYAGGNYQAISGYTLYDQKNKISSALLTKNELGLHLVTGIKDLNKGTPTIFITSSYPGFNVTSIDGAVLSPSLFKPQKPAKKFGLGIDLSYSPLSYNITSGKLSLLNQVTLGAGIHYNLW